MDNSRSEFIKLRDSKDFKGSLNDGEALELIGLSRNKYYKYKKELVNELKNEIDQV